MVNRVKIRENFIVLIVLLISGISFTIKQDSSGQTTLINNIFDNKENESNEKLNCDNDVSDISTILDDQNVNFASDASLFVGCSGFSY